MKLLHEVQYMGAVVFYGIAYVPFCMSILLHTITTSQALDPSDWRLPEMRAYWYSAFALTMLAVAYSLVAPYLLSDGVLGLWIWPILVPAVMFHASTVGYVLRRPELCVLSQKRSFRWCLPRNWLAVGSVVVEFAQLCSIAVSPRVPWRHRQGGSEPGVLQSISGLSRFLFLFESETANFCFCTVIVFLFALLVGETIYSKRCASSPSATMLFEGMAGVGYLTILASLLRVAKQAVERGRQVAVLLGLLFFSVPAIFISIYRGDQRTFSADVNYSPLLLARERVAKELWAVYVVYSTDQLVSQLIAVLVLGAMLLLNLSQTSQFSCLLVVRVRRALLLLAMWTAICALVAMRGPPVVGWVLLLVGGGSLLGTTLTAIVAFAACDLRRQRVESTDAARTCALDCSDAGDAPLQSAAPRDRAALLAPAFEPRSRSRSSSLPPVPAGAQASLLSSGGGGAPHSPKEQDGTCVPHSSQ